MVRETGCTLQGRSGAFIAIGWKEKAMRPPERIDEILALLGQIWKKSPDMRFMQLLYILQMECAESQDGWGKVTETDSEGSERVGFDLFHFEDRAFQRLLEKHVQR